MAKAYSGAKGKAGSKKPIRKVIPSWTRYGAKEVEMLVLKLHKEGQVPSQIGLHLRDVYGIPDVKTLCKKSITQILADKKALNPMPEDLMALIKKLTLIKKHMEEKRSRQSSTTWNANHRVKNSKHDQILQAHRKISKRLDIRRKQSKTIRLKRINLFFYFNLVFYLFYK